MDRLSHLVHHLVPICPVVKDQEVLKAAQVLTSSSNFNRFKTVKHPSTIWLEPFKVTLWVLQKQVDQSKMWHG